MCSYPYGVAIAVFAKVNEICKNVKFPSFLASGKRAAHKCYLILDVGRSPCAFESFSDVISAKKMKCDESKHNKSTQNKGVSNPFCYAIIFHIISFLDSLAFLESTHNALCNLQVKIYEFRTKTARKQCRNINALNVTTALLLFVFPKGSV